MIASQPRTNAIIPFAVDQDTNDMVGYFVMKSGSDSFSICDDEAADVVGVVVQGAPAQEKASIAIIAGGLAGTVKVKLAGPVVTPGTRLQLNFDGRVNPENTSVIRQIVGIALEPGVEGELIEAAVHVGTLKDAVI